MVSKVPVPSHPGPDLRIAIGQLGLSGLKLEIAPHLSVSDQVHAVLRRAIVNVELAPKERISENSICKQFSVSRTPVRAAIQRLAEEGLVDVSPQRGSFVSPLCLDAVRDSHFVRRSLELSLLRETVLVWTPEMGAALRAIIAEQENRVAAQDADGFFQADERFHQTLVGCSGHPGVWAAIQNAKTPLIRFHRYWAHKSRLVDVIAEHRAIIDALDQGDADAAETALARHLDMVFVIFESMSDAQQARLPFEMPARSTLTTQ